MDIKISNSCLFHIKDLSHNMKFKLVLQDCLYSSSFYTLNGYSFTIVSKILVGYIFPFIITLFVTYCYI